MSVLATILNIKVPYASEGVVRTAQIDDTVAPANSAQLAVNMNFDRVGAIQTRPGVAQYADDLASEIKNYGKLNNQITSYGYASLFQLGPTASLENVFVSPVVIKVNSTKVAVFWQGAANVGLCRNYSINQITGALEPLGAITTFDSGVSGIRAVLLNTDRILAVWTNTSLGYAQAFNTAGDTIAVLDVIYNFDAAHGTDFALGKINIANAILFYTSSASANIATTLVVSPSSGAVSVAGTPLTYDTGGTNVSCAPLLTPTSTEWVAVWKKASLQVQYFFVSGSTPTTPGGILTPADFSTSDAAQLVSAEDGAHVVLFGRSDSGSATRGRTLAANTSTGTITEVGTQVNVGLFLNFINVVKFDATHYVVLMSGSPDSAQIVALNTSTFDLTNSGSPFTVPVFDNTKPWAVATISLSEVIVVAENAIDTAGQAIIIATPATITDNRMLYAGYSTKVASVPSGSTTWTDRRTGLATVSKPRFTQYLNFIWMVNGNQLIGGDPIATSDGGAFGSELVPVGFPPADFISAGFEGRVWVGNKTIGVIFYTDIVQFNPDGTYTLTYNPDVNFISTISPNTGEVLTALIQVPRALLYFTQNTITRIYGASSIDAYPAYNVGTFSNESIVQTKTGIFFHHSSGFYQFDYGSQPVEISRRIIDFVKAIPRSSYENIAGVYDGFDNVEWSVGQVVVEGVVFANCVLRYTISTQVWTVYDYVGNTITAMIYYDDGTNLNHLMGTHLGKTGAMDSGTTDFTEPFYFEFIDRWRSYTDMYYQTKEISGVSVYSENASGANLLCQVQKSGPNVWTPIGVVTEKNNSIMANADTGDFDVLRWRLVGNTKGAQVVVHGIEITQLTIKGQEEN